ncbi:hypothetical protein N7488_005831 [Penicillium malachiteum]|nr:hypothetical protein N7488_005831 [Penicillium malachiteum]
MSTSTSLPNPQNSDRDTPTLKATDAILKVGSSAFVTAPAQKVWETLIDTSTWPEWNSFVPRVTVYYQPDCAADDTPSPILQLGTKMTFHARMDPTSTKPQKSTDTGLMVKEFSAPNADTGAPGRIVWAFDPDAPSSFSPSLLVVEREHEVRQVEGGTELRNWEIQVGWLAYVVKWMYGKKLDENFELWVVELKKFVEGEGN